MTLVKKTIERIHCLSTIKCIIFRIVKDAINQQNPAPSPEKGDKQYAN